MQSVYNYIPETNHVSRAHILQLLYSYSSRQFIIIIIIIIILHHIYAGN